MRAELESLLHTARVIEPSAPALDWERVVLVRSRGSLVRRGTGTERNISDRGFHLIVLSATGDPAFYCKCRPTLPDGRRHREAEVLAVFAGDAVARRFVPEASFAIGDRIDLQVTRYLQGISLDLLVPELDPEGRWTLVAEGLQVGRALEQSLRRHMDANGDPSHVVLGRHAREAMSALPKMDVAQQDCDLVRATFETIEPVPALPQHGDFWPQNLIRDRRGTLRVVDMDGFGMVLAPLYDALHFLRTARESAPSTAPKAFIDHLLASDEHGPIMRGLLRQEAERCGLTAAQVGGCALFYLVVIAATTFLRGVPSGIWVPFREQISPACDELRTLGGVAELGAAILA